VPWIVQPVKSLPLKMDIGFWAQKNNGLEKRIVAKRIFIVFDLSKTKQVIYAGVGVSPRLSSGSPTTIREHVLFFVLKQRKERKENSRQIQLLRWICRARAQVTELWVLSVTIVSCFLLKCLLTFFLTECLNVTADS
jgi:hypothetical protein